MVPEPVCPDLGKLFACGVNRPFRIGDRNCGDQLIIDRTHTYDQSVGVLWVAYRTRRPCEQLTVVHPCVGIEGFL